MIDVSEIIDDPDLAQDFTVYRSSGDFGEGGWNETAKTEIPSSGVILPTNSEDLAQIPEGDRITGAMTFYSTSELFTTRNKNEKGTSDEISWRSERYKIVKVVPYVNYGYFKALATRMGGD